MSPEIPSSYGYPAVLVIRKLHSTLRRFGETRYAFHQPPQPRPKRKTAIFAQATAERRVGEAHVRLKKFDVEQLTMGSVFEKFLLASSSRSVVSLTKLRSCSDIVRNVQLRQKRRRTTQFERSKGQQGPKSLQNLHSSCS